MKISYSLPDRPTSSTLKNSSSNLRVITIGNYDGVHLGHRMILNHAISLARTINAESTLLSFSNHPFSVLNESQMVPRLCSPEHKIHLLSSTGLDHFLCIPFTKELSTFTAHQFLQNLQSTLPFSHLVLGQDAAFGKHKEGSRSVVEALSTQLGFEVIYLPDYLVGGKRISSSHVRTSIQKGELIIASNYLGRPFSIFGKVQRGAGRGESLGIQTANLSVAGLCLPPLGVYIVEVIHNQKSYQAIANLGHAPTFKEDRIPLLEVHVLEKRLELYNQHIEVVFRDFIRPEKRFESNEELKRQIAADILRAKEAFSLVF